MSYVEKFKHFVSESKRVLRVTKKPTKDEYLTISKVSGIGILVIGFLGAILHIGNSSTSLAIISIITILLISAVLFIKKGQ